MFKGIIFLPKGDIVMGRPNLFEFATSELSQDAFLCYLLSFSKNEYNKNFPLEYEFSRTFIEFMLGKVGLDIEVESIEIKKQYKNIDVLLIVNDQYYLVIEDKTNTNERKDQIKSYIKELGKEISEKNIKGVYFKTGDESLQNYRNKEYPYINREMIINLFKKYKGNNLIFNDFISNLQDMQNKRDRYLKVHPKKFEWVETIGFYNALDDEFERLKEENIFPKDIIFNWGYTPNQNGGFMCYYFQNVVNLVGESFYLQIEKIKVKDSKEEQKRNTCWTEKEVPYSDITLVLKRCSENKNIKISYDVLELFKKKFEKKFKDKKLLKPNKFSKGTWMTQVLINDYIALDDKETIDIKETALNITEYLDLVISLKEELGKIIENTVN